MTDKTSQGITRSDFLRRGVGTLMGVGIGTPAFLKPVRAAGTVELRDVGSSGIRVSAVGLGASRISEPSLIRRVLDMGVTFLDTGRMYARGRNEELIGRVIRHRRKELVIQSKIDQKIQRDKKAMEKSIDDSLKALGTDYIDIMLIRGATTRKAVENDIVAGVFDAAKKAGKIRLCGFSAHSANAPDMVTCGVAWGHYDVIMVPYNHTGSFTHSIYGIYSEWDQDALEESFALAVSKGVSIIGMKTCSGGPLKKEGEACGTFAAALKWTLKNRHITSVVPAIASFREAEEDVGVMG